MTQKIKIFGVGLISIIIFSSLSNYSLNEIYAKEPNDKDNKNGIKENRGYTEKMYNMTKKNIAPEI